MEKKPSKAFENWLQAAKDAREKHQASLLPYGTYSWGAVDTDQFIKIRERFDALPVAYNKRAELIEQATDFYVSCRERKASPLNPEQLIDLHKQDPSQEANDRYFEELMKFDPATFEGIIVADYLLTCKEDQLKSLKVNDGNKAMYSAIVKTDEVKSTASAQPPKPSP